MNNRFRVSSTLPRKLEELGISPDKVLRQAGLPTGLFKLDGRSRAPRNPQLFRRMLALLQLEQLCAQALEVETWADS